MKIYIRIPAVADCGVGYYRQWLPLQVAEKKKEVKTLTKTFTWGEQGSESGNEVKDPTEEETYKDGEWADVFYFARNDMPLYIAQAGGMRDFFKKPIILDIDDNVQATRPHNPGYRSFHPNSPHMQWNIKAMGVFDGFTVSTQNLKDFYSTYTDKKIYVCPNSLDFKERDEIYKKDFSKSELYKKGEEEIRIGWLGSASHWENLHHIEKPIIDILKKYPNVHFYYTALFGDLFLDAEVQDQIHKAKWSDLKHWAETIVEHNFDIALAPLMDNDFNRAKSNLRVLEYASAHYPVICSPVEPYKVFTDKEVRFAMEKDEWFDAMEDLILKPRVRRELAENLYKRAKRDYDVHKNYKLWVKALKEIKKDYDRTILKSNK